MSAFVIDHIDERESIARSNGVIEVQDALIIVNGGGGRGDEFVAWQVRVRNVGVDVVLHNRIDEVAAGTGAALTGSRQVIERDVVSGVGIDELFARSNAIAGSVILAADFAEVAGPFGGAQNSEDGRSLALAAAPALIGEQRKRVLSFLMGPPIVPPKTLRWNACLGRLSGRK